MNISIYRNWNNVMEVDLEKEKILNALNPAKITKETLDGYNNKVLENREILIDYFNGINEDDVIKEIQQHKVYKQLVRAVGYRHSKQIIKCGIATLLFVATNGVYALANNEIIKAGKDFEAKMNDVFVLVAIVGGQLLIMAALIEIGSSIYKGNRENVIGIVAKYILIYISMLLMPAIMKFTRKLVLGW